MLLWSDGAEMIVGGGMKRDYHAILGAIVYKMDTSWLGGVEWVIARIE